jgi:hypothetical protein
MSASSRIPVITVGKERLNSPHSRLPFSIPSSKRINASRHSSRTSSWAQGGQNGWLRDELRRGSSVMLERSKKYKERFRGTKTSETNKQFMAELQGYLKNLVWPASPAWWRQWLRCVDLKHVRTRQESQRPS